MLVDVLQKRLDYAKELEYHAPLTCKDGNVEVCGGMTGGKLPEAKAIDCTERRHPENMHNYVPWRTDCPGGWPMTRY